jgi:hypothetical protein
MNVVYLLITGGVDSRHVIGVYTDRIRAQDAADAINAHPTAEFVDAEVEGCELDPAMADVMAEALWLWEHSHHKQLKDYERRKHEAGIED